MPPQREWLETDYYAVLGVAKDASQDEIKKAYRRLARESHPDANPDDPKAESRFKQVGEAYRVVGDPDTRKEYDELRRLGGAGTGGNPFAGGNPFGAGGDPFGSGVGGDGGAAFEDLLRMFQREGGFGRGAGQPRGRTAAGRRGRDREAEVHLSFEDALAGVRTRLRINGEATCRTCNGSRSRPGSTPEACSRCGGTGRLSLDQGPFAIAQPCPRCGGEGRVVTDPCEDCGGVGRTVQPEEITVRIPPGVRDGAVIRVPGKGAPGERGGRAGDLLVRIDVEPDPLFGRRGDDVTLELPVSFSEAALGTKLAVPTPDGGSRTIRVPAGTQHGATFRLRGEGATGKGGATGDLLVTVRLEVPTRLSRKQKQLVEQLAEHDDHAERERLVGRRTQEAT